MVFLFLLLLLLAFSTGLGISLRNFNNSIVVSTDFFSFRNETKEKNAHTLYWDLSIGFVGSNFEVVKKFKHKWCGFRRPDSFLSWVFFYILNLCLGSPISCSCG